MCAVPVWSAVVERANQASVAVVVSVIAFDPAPPAVEELRQEVEHLHGLGGIAARHGRFLIAGTARVSPDGRDA
jgi:hypothetical protein